MKDWIPKSNAVYNGTEQLDSSGPYDKWWIEGLQDNFYWEKRDSVRTPRKLFQVPEDDMDFTRFIVGPPAEDKFILPEYCTDKCGPTSFCAKFQGNMISE